MCPCVPVWAVSLGIPMGEPNGEHTGQHGAGIGHALVAYMAIGFAALCAVCVGAIVLSLLGAIVYVVGAGMFGG